MTVQISFGWWMLPALVTIIALLARWSVHRNDPPSHGGYDAIGDGLGRAFSFLMALVIPAAPALARQPAPVQ